MVTIILEVSKYLMIILFAVYTLLSFFALKKDPMERNHTAIVQRYIIFFIQVMGAIDAFVYTQDVSVLFFFLAQEALFVFILVNYWIFYEDAPKVVINHMCMLLSIGFIMLVRLDFSLAVKQLAVAALSTVITIFIPVIIKKVTVFDRFRILYAAGGILALCVVAVLGAVSYGAKLSISLGGFSVQLSEFVKIVFVFYLASALKTDTSFKNVVKVSFVAAAHVLVLVASKDLGAALIFFVVYLVVLYVASHNVLYLLAGFGAGGVGAVASYFLFSHVRTRVIAWKDPFAVIDGAGYQVSQSLFAIGSGGWFGSGLYLGYPESVPVVEEDFIFSAIAEELGCIFAICLIIVCVGCFFLFLNIAMQIRTKFYKLVALGLGVTYIVQVFLMIGGVTKFIPSTGVTLPLVSYGGSSLLSTFVIFSLILGLYMFKETENEYIERKEQKEQKKQSKRDKANSRL
ncbi:MAG: FtsW/RodA/SpoVE family cell cycle protein [Eubacterium sp.]|nr:FtsW/RodA/SpoVE family cell cycle protein [Eubacterium sp.]